MALPDFTMRDLLEAGVHFGHQTHRWNPKMKSFIYTERSGIHIINLSKSVPLLHQALVKVRDTVAGGGRVLFIGTKRQAAQPIAEAAQRCAQYYMNHRWLGGTLTNWATVSNSIKRLRQLETILADKDTSGLTKKELLNLEREREKLDKVLGGIANMGGLPDLVFVVDTNKEAIAIREARKLGIPVVAVIDSNCDPQDADFLFPGNDDATRAIVLYCNLVADAVLDGLAQSSVGLGIDVGEDENAAAPADPALAEAFADDSTEEQSLPSEESPASDNDQPATKDTEGNDQPVTEGKK